MQSTKVGNDRKATRRREREERFERVATARVNLILDKLRLLGQCSNKSNYSYTPEQTRAIFSAISDELRRTKQKFEVTSPARNGKFSL